MDLFGENVSQNKLHFNSIYNDYQYLKKLQLGLMTIITWDYQWVCIQSYSSPCYCSDGGIYVYCSRQAQGSTVSHFVVSLFESSVKCSASLQLDVEVFQCPKMSYLPAKTQQNSS